MTALATVAAQGCGPKRQRLAFTPLWGEEKRKDQLRRLRSLQRQECDEAGQAVWNIAFEKWSALPAGCRVDLPSPRVFGALLGLFRTCTTLKDGPMHAIEVSVEEIADLVMYSRAQVAAALRWLGNGAIEYFGYAVATGLGFINREPRFGKGKFGDKIALAYRTSLSALTIAGRMLLGLPQLDDSPAPAEDKKRARRQRYKKERSASRQKQGTAHLHTAAPSLADHVNRDERVDLRSMTAVQLDFEVMGARHLHPSAHNYVFPTESEWQAKNSTYVKALHSLVSYTQVDTRDAVPDYIANGDLKV